jgi:hypothetical protein
MLRCDPAPGRSSPTELSPAIVLNRAIERVNVDSEHPSCPAISGTVQPRVDGHPKVTPTTITANRTSCASAKYSSMSPSILGTQVRLADTRSAHRKGFHRIDWMGGIARLLPFGRVAAIVIRGAVAMVIHANDHLPKRLDKLRWITAYGDPEIRKHSKH